MTKVDAIQALPFATAVLVREPLGCCHHTWLSDPNDGGVSLEGALAAGHGDCIAVAKLAVRMGPTQIRKLRHLAWECYEQITYPDRFDAQGRKK